MLIFLKRRWFLLLLVVALVAGMGFPEWLSVFPKKLPKEWIIGSVLFAMTLPLRIDAMWETLRRPLPALLAVAINSIVLPIMAWSVSGLLNEDLALGMIIAASVPCTLASAAVWTRLAGGNDAVSILVTMITNLSCFVVTPALIYLLAGQTVGGVTFAETAQKLFVLIVLPIFLAQLLRCVPPIGNWATENKQVLSIYSQLGILSIVFVGAVHCGLRLIELENELSSVAGQILLMLILVAAVHLVAWWLGFWSAARAKIDRADQIAVAFSGSQKTLMVGLAVALQYGGMTVLPMLAYHIEQLFIDTLLADRLRFKAEDQNESAEDSENP